MGRQWCLYNNRTKETVSSFLCEPSLNQVKEVMHWLGWLKTDLIDHTGSYTYGFYDFENDDVVNFTMLGAGHEPPKIFTNRRNQLLELQEPSEGQKETVVFVISGHNTTMKSLLFDYSKEVKMVPYKRVVSLDGLDPESLEYRFAVIQNEAEPLMLAEFDVPDLDEDIHYPQWQDQVCKECGYKYDPDNYQGRQTE